MKAGTVSGSGAWSEPAMLSSYCAAIGVGWLAFSAYSAKVDYRFCDQNTRKLLIGAFSYG